MSIDSSSRLPFSTPRRSWELEPMSGVPVSRSPLCRSAPVQGSALIGWVVALFALLLLATPPLAVLSLAREKPAPVAPAQPVVVSKFA